MQGPPECFDPNVHRVRILLELPVDQLRDLRGVALDDGCREVLLRWEMIMNARALDANFSCDLSKTEAVEAADPDTPLGGVHDGGSDVTHGSAPVAISR